MFVPTVEGETINERWRTYQYRIRMDVYKQTAKKAARAEHRRFDGREQTATIAWLAAAAGDLKQQKRSVSREAAAKTQALCWIVQETSSERYVVCGESKLITLTTVCSSSEQKNQKNKTKIAIYLFCRFIDHSTSTKLSNQQHIIQL